MHQTVDQGYYYLKSSAACNFRKFVNYVVFILRNCLQIDEGRKWNSGSSRALCIK